MLRILTATSLLALAAIPALAQTGTQPTTPPADHSQHGSAHSAMPATPAVPAQPRTGDMDTMPATPAMPAQPNSASADSRPRTTSAEPREVTVQKLVDAEFPIYDVNKNGNLESAEFSNWVLALYDESGDANAPKDAASKAKWSKAAFATADADTNKSISIIEMNRFLGGA